MARAWTRFAHWLALATVCALGCGDAGGAGVGGADAGAPDAAVVERYGGPYYGGLHSHTTYAWPDYAGTPLDAWRTARSYVLPGTDFDINAGTTDWWAVTDYYWSLALMWPENWSPTLEQADAVRAEGFPAIIGWEWSILTAGTPEQRDHIGCFALDQAAPRLPLEPTPRTGGLQAFAPMMSLTSLYETMAALDHVCSFNHPEMRSTDEPLPAFDAFAFDETADGVMGLIDIRGEGAGLRGYFQALNRGWHVSPTQDEDNKLWDWGLKVNRHGAQRRIGVFAEANTIEGIMAGLREGTTFATSDASLWGRLSARPDGGSETYFMGSALRGVESVELMLDAGDRDLEENVRLPYYPIVCGQTGCREPTDDEREPPAPDSPSFTAAWVYTNGGERLSGAPEALSGAHVVREWTGLDARGFHDAVVVHPREDGTNAENPTRSVWYVLALEQADGDRVVTAPIYVHLD